MKIKFATLTMHDGKTVVKVNPQRVLYLMSLDIKTTKIHFGTDLTVVVDGGLEAVEKSLSISLS